MVSSEVTMALYNTKYGIAFVIRNGLTESGPKTIVIGVFTYGVHSISYMKIDKDQVECFQCKYARGTKGHKV